MFAAQEARQINAILKPVSYQTAAFRDGLAQQILERIVTWRVRPDEMIPGRTVSVVVDSNFQSCLVIERALTSLCRFCICYCRYIRPIPGHEQTIENHADT